MKKIALFFTLSIFIKYTFCQNADLPKIVNDTLYTASGYKITVGQQIKPGIGTKDDGDFKYISTSNSFLPNGREQSLRRNRNGHTVIVKKVETGRQPEKLLCILYCCRCW